MKKSQKKAAAAPKKMAAKKITAVPINHSAVQRQRIKEALERGRTARNASKDALLKTAEAVYKVEDPKKKAAAKKMTAVPTKEDLELTPNARNATKNLRANLAEARATEAGFRKHLEAVEAAPRTAETEVSTIKMRNALKDLQATIAFCGHGLV